MAKARGECLFCSGKIPLYLKLRSSEFCSEAHRDAYTEEQQRLALERLIETEKILNNARARKLIFKSQRVAEAESAATPAPIAELVSTRNAGPILDSPDTLRPAHGWGPANRANGANPIVGAVAHALPVSTAEPLGEPLNGRPHPPASEPPAGGLQALAALAGGVMRRAGPPAQTAVWNEAAPFQVSTSYPQRPATRPAPQMNVPVCLELGAVAARPPLPNPAVVQGEASFATAVVLDWQQPGIAGGAGCALAAPVRVAGRSQVPEPPVCRSEGAAPPEVPATALPGSHGSLRSAPVLPLAPLVGVPFEVRQGSGGDGVRLAWAAPERMAPRLALPAATLLCVPAGAFYSGNFGGTRADTSSGTVDQRGSAGMRRATADPEPPLCDQPLAVSTHFALGEEVCRAYGPAPGAPNLLTAVPALEAAPAGENHGFSLAAGARLDPGSAVRDREVEAEGAAPPAIAATPIEPAPELARSAEVLRRARERTPAEPPLCTDLLAWWVGRLAADGSALPAPPGAGEPLNPEIACRLPDSGLAPQRWAETRPDIPQALEAPGFQPPPEVPAPVLRPMFPMLGDPAFGAPARRRFWHFRLERCRRVAGQAFSRRGLSIAAGLILLAGIGPAISNIGGLSGIRQAAAGSSSSFEKTIADRAGVKLTEDFRSPFDKWEGRRRPELTWKVDDDGFVIPGELAVYAPTERMADYRVEFLGGIGKKALSWAFRMQDRENYHVARIVESRPRPQTALVLERYSVIGGKETPHRTNPISLSIRGESMMNVRMDVNGSDFVVRVENRIVDSWSDRRIGSGGVGFFSNKGESSKIRWVTVEYQYDMLGRVCSWFAASPVISVRN